MEYSRNGTLIKKKYLEYFIPSILMNIATQLASLSDKLIVGNLLGSDAMSAVSLTMPFVQLYFSFSILIGVGASVLIAVSKGASDEKKADRLFSSAFYFSIIISVALLLVQMFFTRQCCQLLTTNEVLFSLTEKYFSIMIYNCPFMIVTFSMLHIVGVDGNPKLASIVSISMNIVNIIFDFVFIKYCNMGLEGAALATVLGYLVGFCQFLFLYLFTKKRTLHFTSDFVKVFPQICSSGLPSVLGAVLVVFKIQLINIIVDNVAGTTGVTAFAICLTCLSLVSMFIAGVIRAMVPILGVYFGEQDKVGIKIVLTHCFYILTITIVVLSVLLEIFPKALVLIHGVKDANVVAMVVPAMKIFTLSLLGNGITALMIYYYSVVNRKLSANIISILEGFIFVIPFAWLFAKYFSLNGVMFAFVLAEILTFVIIAIQNKFRLSNIVKIEDNVYTEQLNISVKSGDISKATESVQKYMEQKFSDKSIANKIAIAIDELCNMSKTQCKHEVDIDLRVRCNDKTVMLSYADDGKAINVTQCEQSDTFSGVSMLKAISSDVSYQWIIGLNKINVFLNRN